MSQNEVYPVVVIGAGPIGLAAAANLLERGIQPLVLEGGAEVAANMRSFGHVKLFTPWSYLLDPATERVLKEHSDWSAPNPKKVPLVGEFVEEYLDKFVELEQVSPCVRFRHKVTSVSRVGHDRMKDGKRDESPFLLVLETPEGVQRILAKAVIDASGTWADPNPMGAGGVYSDGEMELQNYIEYGMPDVLLKHRSRYQGKRVLVVGSGHSAIGTVLNLAELKQADPETSIAWAVRRKNPKKLWGGGSADEIQERGILGTKVYEVVHSGEVKLLTGLAISGIRQTDEGLEISDQYGEGQIVVDEVIVATGSRPNLAMLRELRLELDLPTEAPLKLGPLIDPNHHSCGSVPPHGVEELAHPEEDFYLVGMKSYGRAPTFLMRTGYEQVRSIAAELAGDHIAARTLQLELPQTGVCSTDLAFDEESGQRSCC